MLGIECVGHDNLNLQTSLSRKRLSGTGPFNVSDVESDLPSHPLNKVKWLSARGIGDENADMRCAGIERRWRGAGDVCRDGTGVVSYWTGCFLMVQVGASPHSSQISS
jgi:hypothetical protein